MAEQGQGDFRNNKYTFGYLNTAQESYDIEENGLAELHGVDIDALALGTVRSANYKDAGAGPPDWNNCEIVGDQFRISSSPTATTTYKYAISDSNIEYTLSGSKPSPATAIYGILIYLTNIDVDIAAYEISIPVSDNITVKSKDGLYEDTQLMSNQWRTFGDSEHGIFEVYLNIFAGPSYPGVGSEFHFTYSKSGIEYNAGTDATPNWMGVDSYLPAPPPISYVMEESSGGIEYIDPGLWTGFSVSDITVEGEKGSANPVVSNKVMINPSNYSQGNKTFTYKIRIKSGGTEFERWIIGVDSGYVNSYSISGTNGTVSGYHDIEYGINVSMDQAETFIDGDEFTFNVAQDLLEDGNYTYVVSEVTKIDGSEIESLYSDTTKVSVRNEDYLGKLVSYSRPILSIQRHPGNERWVYRKGPRDEEWYRLFKVAPGTGSATKADNISVNSLTDTIIIDDLNPSTTAELLNRSSSTDWGFIFEKDNRLWAVPDQKKDVVFFSEPLEWWRWGKSSSLGFNGDFRGIAHIRDEQSVSLQNTACVVTSEGLYNIQGSGTKEDNYVRVVHESNFGTVQDSLVKVNNVLYMVSDGTNYEDGEWGRKLYSFDLMQLTELSAIVQKSDPFVDNSKTISYVNQIGGNKIKILMSDNTYMIYHIQGKGFGESSLSAESSGGEWRIKTRTETPMNSYVGKFHNADRIRIRWKGDITFTWTVDGVALPSITASSATENVDEFAVPGTFGKSYSLTIEGDLNSGALLYDMYLVKES